MFTQLLQLTDNKQLIFLLSETVRLEKQQESKVPALWHRIIPMVTIINNKVLLE